MLLMSRLNLFLSGIALHFILLLCCVQGKYFRQSLGGSRSSYHSAKEKARIQFSFSQYAVRKREFHLSVAGHFSGLYVIATSCCFVPLAYYIQHRGNQLALFHIYYIGIMCRVFTNGLRNQDSIPGWVMPTTQKMVLGATYWNGWPTYLHTHTFTHVTFFLYLRFYLFMNQ